MTVPELTLDRAAFLCGAVASLGIVYNTVEYWAARRQILEWFFDWRILRTRYYILLGRPLLTCIFDILLSGRLFLALITGHGLAALLFPFVLLINPHWAAPLAAFVLAVHALSNIRLLIGRDGADQMQSIVWAGLFFYCLPIPDWARTVGIALIPAQLILSYLVSGIAKASSPVWRGGTAISLITRTATYCPRNVARWLTIPAISFLACWLTITFEVGGPFLLLGGRPGTLGLIALGTLFHIGIALAMGLTTFVFAFLAAFPVLYSLAGLLGS